MAGEDQEEGRRELAAASTKPAESEAPASGASAAARSSTLAEWTASDARGGLNEVGATPAAGPEPIAAGPAAHEFAAEAAPIDTPPSPETASVRRASFWPVAAGIVLGAAIGAGSAYTVYANAPADPAVEQRVAALAGQVDAVSHRPDPQLAIAALQASLSDLSGKVAALPRSQPAETPSGGAPTPLPSTANADSGLQQKVATLQTTVETLQRQTATASDLTAAQGKIAAVAAGLSDMQKQASAARGDVQSLQSGQKALEGKITSAPALAVVADSLVERINRGLPFTAQVSALDSLGVDPAKLAVLRQFADQGVPSATVLASKFEPLTDGLLSTATKPAASAGFWDRLKSGASGLVSIHRVDDIQGDDAASRVARIKVDLAHNDVVDAVATWTALPAAAKAKPESAAWGALAKTHAEAITAADGIEHDAIAALAAKKS